MASHLQLTPDTILYFLVVSCQLDILHKILIEIKEYCKSEPYTGLQHVKQSVDGEIPRTFSASVNLHCEEGYSTAGPLVAKCSAFTATYGKWEINNECASMPLLILDCIYSFQLR